MALGLSVWEKDATGKERLSPRAVVLTGILGLGVVALLLYPIVSGRNGSVTEQGPNAAQNAQAEQARLVQKNELDSLRSASATTTASTQKQKVVLDSQNKTKINIIQDTEQQKSELDALRRLRDME